MTSRAVDVCFFDMDGVIRHWPPEEADRAEDAAGLPRGTLVSTAMALPEYQRGVLGEVSFEDWSRST
jgi:hypothetical protein